MLRNKVSSDKAIASGIIGAAAGGLLGGGFGAAIGAALGSTLGATGTSAIDINIDESETKR